MNIIVTGASRGIGLAILEKFAQNGWNIAFCSKNSESVSKAKAHLANTYPNIKILAHVVDMGQKDEVLNFANECIKILGKIDVLVNNAGQYIPGKISDTNYEDNLEELMKINLYSAYWMSKVIVPDMKSNTSGHIFNIVSIAGMQAYPNGGSYAITKFAMQGFTRTLRDELKLENIRVTGVYPGATLTDSWASAGLPPERFINVKDIAELIYTTHLLSPSSTVEDIVIRPQLGDI